MLTPYPPVLTFLHILFRYEVLTNAHTRGPPHPPHNPDHSTSNEPPPPSSPAPPFSPAAISATSATPSRPPASTPPAGPATTSHRPSTATPRRTWLDLAHSRPDQLTGRPPPLATDPHRLDRPLPQPAPHRCRRPAPPRTTRPPHRDPPSQRHASNPGAAGSRPRTDPPDPASHHTSPSRSPMSHPEGRSPVSRVVLHHHRAAAPQVTDRVLLLWNNTGRDHGEHLDRQLRQRTAAAVVRVLRSWTSLTASAHHWSASAGCGAVWIRCQP